MASQRDVRNKIASVKNIQKITRAMEMVAAARLRRAEQRIAALRPYADAIGRMTRQAARTIADDLIESYVDGKLDRVDVIYNHYVSPLTQRVTQEQLLPLSSTAITGEDGGEAEGDGEAEHEGPRALVDYEPDPEQILR